MTEKTYWRGYIDGQGQIDWSTECRMAKSQRQGILKPLSELIKEPIIEYRSGYMVLIADLNKTLPQKIDRDYIRGWFAGSGKTIKKPELKLTITGSNVERFGELVKEIFKIELPKAMKPNKTSKSMRIIVTHDKAKELFKCLKQDEE